MLKNPTVRQQTERLIRQSVFWRSSSEEIKDDIQHHSSVPWPPWAHQAVIVQRNCCLKVRQKKLHTAPICFSVRWNVSWAWHPFIYGGLLRKRSANCRDIICLFWTHFPVCCCSWHEVLALSDFGTLFHGNILQRAIRGGFFLSLHLMPRDPWSWSWMQFHFQAKIHVRTEYRQRDVRSRRNLFYSDFFYLHNLNSLHYYYINTHFDFIKKIYIPINR